MVPTEVKGMGGHKMVDVSCSSGDGHTLAVTDKGMNELIVLPIIMSFAHV